MATWLALLFLAPVAFPEDPALRAAALEARVSALCQAGRCAEAESLARQALLSWEIAARTQPVDLAAPNANLAAVYLDKGNLPAAERYALAAQAFQKQTQASADDQARVASLLGRVRFQQGRYAESAVLQEEALRVFEAPESKAAAWTAAVARNNLAMARAATGDLREARRLLERSVEMHQQDGPAPGMIGDVLGNLALVCVKLGDVPAAELWYRRSILQTEAVLGPGHPHLGILLGEYAKLLRKMGRKPEARRVNQRAKEILASAVSPGQHTVDVHALR